MSHTISQRLLSDKVSQMSESATIKMSSKARELKAQGIDVISLSLGEPDFDTPDHIKEAAKKALDEGYTKYTPVPGLPDYVKAIQTKLKRDNNLDYETNEIMVSTGAKQCIANTALALLNKGDEVIIFTPYWVSYFDIVKFVGGTPITVSADIHQDFKVSPDQLREAMSHKTKLIIFSSPCNPTGSVYTADELAALAEVIKESDHVMVLSDEIYEHINFGGEHASIAAVEGMKERTIVVNGMSKGFAMTGWRLGYMAAPDWIIKACSKVQGQFTSGTNNFSQKAAAHALLGDMKPSEVMKAAFLKRKGIVKEGLERIPGIKVNDPKGAFYFFPDISYYFKKTKDQYYIDDANDFCEYILENAHVALVSGSAFGDDNCVRLSYAASEEQLREALRRIEEALKGFE